MLVLDETTIVSFIDDQIKHYDRRAERSVTGKITSEPEYHLDISSQEDYNVVLEQSLPPLQSSVISARVSADIRRARVLKMQYPDYLASALRESAVLGGQWEALSTALAGMGLR